MVRTGRWRGLLVLALAIALLPLALPNRYYVDIAILVGLNAIACVGLNLLVGYAGQISLGHAGFLGLGAYASAVLSTRYGWPPLAALVAGAAGVALLATAVGRPILRLRGHYLAMATLGLGMIVAIVVNTEAWLTGGPDGMAVARFTLLGWTLRGEQAWYWAVGAVLLAAVWLALNLVDSPAGRALRALGGAEVAAETAGIDTATAKLRVFVLSAVFASIAGSLSAHYAEFVTPDKVGFLKSIELVTMVVLGGLASTWGAVVGALILTVLPQLLTTLRDYETVVFGAILITVMIFLPRGLVPTLAVRLGGRRR